MWNKCKQHFSCLETMTCECVCRLHSNCTLVTVMLLYAQQERIFRYHAVAQIYRRFSLVSGTRCTSLLHWPENIMNKGRQKKKHKDSRTRKCTNPVSGILNLCKSTACPSNSVFKFSVKRDHYLLPADIAVASLSGYWHQRIPHE